MIIASWNVNGIRACFKKGFLDWFESSNFDVVCLQEVRALPEQFPKELQNIDAYHANWFAAEKKGYSGVGILSKEEPQEVIFGLGVKKFDQEGRVITCVYKDVVVVSAYFPNSQDKGKRVNYKIEFCREISKFISDLRAKKRKPLVLNGDFNVAHKEIDLARPKDNHQSAGFLPEERSWMDEFTSAGWVDTFRYLYPTQKDRYSWWSARTRARDRNIGWRIDYHVLHKKDVDYIVDAQIQDNVLGSDHCPVLLTLDLSL